MYVTKKHLEEIKRAADDRGRDNAKHRFLGRIETQIEFFADSISVPPLEFAAWIGAELSHVAARAGDRMQVLPVAAGKRSTGTSKVEGDGKSHRRQAWRVAKARSRARKAGHAAEEVTPDKGKAQRDYWAKMTPEERSAESARRRKKWSPEAKARWHNRHAA